MLTGRTIPTGRKEESKSGCPSTGPDPWAKIVPEEVDITHPCALELSSLDPSEHMTSFTSWVAFFILLHIASLGRWTPVGSFAKLKIIIFRKTKLTEQKTQDKSAARQVVCCAP